MGSEALFRGYQIGRDMELNAQELKRLSIETGNAIESISRRVDSRLNEADYQRKGDRADHDRMIGEVRGELATLGRRVAELRETAHEPFDFKPLVDRLAKAESILGALEFFAKDQNERTTLRLAELETKIRTHANLEASISQLRKELADEASARRKLEDEHRRLSGRVGELAEDDDE